MTVVQHTGSSVDSAVAETASQIVELDALIAEAVGVRASAVRDVDRLVADASAATSEAASRVLAALDAEMAEFERIVSDVYGDERAPEQPRGGANGADSGEVETETDTETETETETVEPDAGSDPTGPASVITIQQVGAGGQGRLLATVPFEAVTGSMKRVDPALSPADGAVDGTSGAPGEAEW